MDIKFRGQSKNGKWHYGYLWKSSDGIWWIKDFKNLEDNQVKKETIGQFTGRLDKNKKEIYAGDIIRMAYHGISEVFFRNGGYKINGKLSVVGFGSQAKYSEIIGNKFTTPELINN